MMFQARGNLTPASRSIALQSASMGNIAAQQKTVSAAGSPSPLPAQGYADVPLSAAAPRRSMDMGATGPGVTSFDQPVKAMSASGTGTVASDYTPEASDTSTKIVFVQVMRESLDGMPAKPSASDTSFSYQDADTTSDMYHVDYVSGEKDPYYNGDDTGDFGVQGNATITPPIDATTTDTPHYNDGTFPGASTTLLYEFRTAAFSAAGADAGKYYGYADWTYAKTKGSPEKTAVAGSKSGDPGSNFKDAVTLFCSNHGFTLPTQGLGKPLSALAGAGIGAIAGAALGAFGGPVGALVGGLVGAGIGAIAGAIAG